MASTGTPLRVTRSKFAAASPEATLCTSGISARQAVSQKVLSLPIPLRLLLAAQPKLVTPVLQVWFTA